MNSLSLAKYLEYCESSEESLLKLLSKQFEDTTRYDDTSNPVAMTWIISFNQILQENPLAARLFKLVCFLAERGIPIELLAQGHNEIETNEAIGNLLGYAFVTRQRGSDLLDIHRLVRLAMQNWLEQRKERRKAFANTVEQLERWLSETSSKSIVFSMRALSHVRTILGGPEPFEALPLARILFESADCWKVLGYFVAREGFLRLTFQLRAHFLGAEHPDTLKTCFPLAGALLDMRRNKEALEVIEHIHRNMSRSFDIIQRRALMGVFAQEEVCEQDTMVQEASQKAVQLCEQYLGAEHDDLSWLWHGFDDDITLKDSGKTEAFIQRFRATIQQWETARSIEDRSTLKLMEHLGNFYAVSKKYEKAEGTYRELLETRTKVLGLENPDTISTAVSLAGTLFYQSKYQEAESILRRTLETQKRVLGVKHPDTLQTVKLPSTVLLSSREDEVQWLGDLYSLQAEVLGNGHRETVRTLLSFAFVLRSQQKFNAAEKAYRDILKLREKDPGIGRSNTSEAMFGLACTLDKGQKLGEAEHVYRRVLNMRKKTLGVLHPDTLEAMYSLALVLERRQKVDEAEQVYRKVFKLRKRTLGLEHPATLASMLRLGSVFQEQKRPQAVHVYQDLVKLYKRKNGIEHPDALHLHCLWRLGLQFLEQQQYEKAEQTFRDCLTLSGKELGIEHPETSDALFWLAISLQNQGKLSEAEQTFRDCLTSRGNELGIEHPKTIDALYWLAISLRDQEKFSEAEQTFRDCLTLREKELGIEHPNTANTFFWLVTSLGHQGKFSEAAQMFRDYLEKGLGIEHSKTIDAIYWLATSFENRGEFSEAEQTFRKLWALEKRGICVEGVNAGYMRECVLRLLLKQDKETEAFELWMREVRKKRCLPFLAMPSLRFYLFIENVCHAIRLECSVIVSADLLFSTLASNMR